jgi:hypothetical protein
VTQDIDYANISIPEDEPPEEYHYTARRAEILQRIEEVGSPAGVNQSELAERYDVDPSQISRDFDALGEYVAEALGSRDKLATRAMFHRVVRDLLEEDDWRATKAAWDVVSEWNDWLADLGEQHREPDKSEVDVEMDARTAEVSYTIVRGAEGDADPLPTSDEGDVDYEDLGFTTAPASIEVDNPTEEANR